MFHRISIVVAIMMMVVSLWLLSGTDAKAEEVESIFSTYFVKEYPVLTDIGEAQLASRAAMFSSPSIRILMLKGGKVDIGASQRMLPVVRRKALRQALVGVAEDRKGRRVHFKVVRGKLLPSPERETATYPHDMSACFTDEKGRSLFQLSVGDSIGDLIPECGAKDATDSIESRIAEFDDLPALSEQERYTMNVIRIMSVLKKLDFAAEFGEEYRVLTEQRSFLRKAHTPNEEIVASDRVVIMDENGAPVPNGTTLTQANLELASRAAADGFVSPAAIWLRGRRHAVQAHAGWIHGLWYLAEHSATYTARYEEWPAPFGKYYDVRINCNHGRCPNEMVWRYLWLSAPRGWAHVHNWFCVTSYNAFSWTGTHNCNDDTVCETRSVRYDVHWNELWGTPCSDSYLRKYCPGIFE